MTAAVLLAGGGSLHDRLERLVAGVLVGEDVLVGRGDPIGGGSPCQVAGCPRPMLPEGLCGPHRARWRSAGWPDIEYWDSGLPVPPIVVHLAGLPRAVQLEVAYGMDRARRDPNPPTMSVKSLQRLIRVLRTRRVESLADDGRTPVPTNGPFGGGRMHAEFLQFVVDELDELAGNAGADTEYQRDSWRLRRLGYTGGHAGWTLGFQIPQPWLSAVAKRFVRWRADTGELVKSSV